MKVKVRIAVSVDYKGNWCSAGWEGFEENEAHALTIDSLEPGERRYWLEAELESPKEPEVIQPKVTEA